MRDGDGKTPMGMKAAEALNPEKCASIYNIHTHISTYIGSGSRE